MCNCNQATYQTNMSSSGYNFNPNINTNCGHQQNCSGCLEIIKSSCIAYEGSNLVNLGVNKNDTLKDILVILNAIKLSQDNKFAKILLNLNDINSRINVITGGTPHVPYTLA